MLPEYRTLRRSRHDRMIAGICGGLAEFFGLSPTKFRIIYILVSAASVAFPGIICYLLLWLLIPNEDEELRL